jgi:calcineurin-like phosphoesterase family protein
VTIFVISDTHFRHENILTFKDETGAFIRPGFANVEEMDEHMIACWNKVVTPSDHVYHLGDVTMLRGSGASRIKPLLDRLNGHKRLVMGNHDHMPADWYMQWFEKVKGQNMIDGWLMTHYPVHPASLGRAKANVHGHIHERRVLLSPHHPDPRYINVSVEAVNYTPIALEALSVEKDWAA